MAGWHHQRSKLLALQNAPADYKNLYSYFPTVLVNSKSVSARNKKKDALYLGILFQKIRTTNLLS